MDICSEPAAFRKGQARALYALLAYDTGPLYCGWQINRAALVRAILERERLQTRFTISAIVTPYGFGGFLNRFKMALLAFSLST